MPHSPTPSLSCGLPASPAKPSLLPQQAPHPPDHPAPCTSCWAVFVTSFLPLQMLFQLPGMHPPTHTHTCFNSWVCPCDLFQKPSLRPLCGCVRGSLHGPLHAAYASPSRVPTRQCCWGWSRPGAPVPGWVLPPQGARPRASHTEGRREGLHSAEPKSWERHALLPTDRPLATRLSYFYLSPCRAEAGQAGSPTESVRPARRREDTCCGCRGRRLAGRPHGLLYLESCRPRATNPLLWESPARRSWVRGPALPRSP